MFFYFKPLFVSHLLPKYHLLQNQKKQYLLYYYLTQKCK